MNLLWIFKIQESRGGGRCFFVFYAFKEMFFFLNIEKCPFTFWLNGRWFLQIVDREF